MVLAGVGAVRVDWATVAAADSEVAVHYDVDVAAAAVVNMVWAGVRLVGAAAVEHADAV